MLGVLISLTEQETEVSLAYLKSMQEIVVESVFISLQIPEEDPTVIRRNLKTVGAYLKAEKINLIADVSPRTLDNFSLGELKDFGVTGLRIDNGFTVPELLQVQKDYQLILNASTVNEALIKELQEQKIDLTKLEAWHNYYPRPETGLDMTYFETVNLLLQAHGIKVGAFIPGDELKRLPIKAGLPTLEQQRYKSSFYCYLDLLDNYGVENIYIGDLSISFSSYSQFKILKEGALPLRAKFYTGSPLLLMKHHNRIDQAARVIRSNEARRLSQTTITPENTIQRPLGAITLDNQLAGRYQGELQITLQDLPSASEVNIIGQVIEADLDLLEFVLKGRPFYFVASESVSTK